MSAVVNEACEHRLADQPTDDGTELCKDCGRAITWTGPRAGDYDLAADPNPRNHLIVYRVTAGDLDAIAGRELTAYELERIGDGIGNSTIGDCIEAAVEQVAGLPEDDEDQDDEPDCGQDFMAGTICSLPASHVAEGTPHGTTCRECGADWYDGPHKDTCSHFTPEDDEDPRYPNGQCSACGFGLWESGGCPNPDCERDGDKIEPEGDLDRIGLTDQPTTCPKCGSRTDHDDLPDEPDGTKVQSHTCLGCGYTFLGVWDVEDQLTLQAEDGGRDVTGWNHHTADECDCAHDDNPEAGHLFPPEGSLVMLMVEREARVQGTDNTMQRIGRGEVGRVHGYVPAWHDVHVAFPSADGEDRDVCIDPDDLSHVQGIVRVDVSPCASDDEATRVVDDAEAQFWTVYLRHQDGEDSLAYAESDHDTRPAAEDRAAQLAEFYSNDPDGQPLEVEFLDCWHSETLPARSISLLLHGAGQPRRVSLAATPRRVVVGGQEFTRVDDPATGEFLGCYTLGSSDS